MIHFSLITPERVLYEGDADSVSLPTPQGEITVLPHHIPLVSIVMPGTLVVRKGAEETVFAVTRGVVEVNDRNLRVLADTADRAEELEEAAIEKAKKEAQKLLTERRADAAGFAEATAVLDRELARLAAVRRRRTRTRMPHVGNE